MLSCESKRWIRRTYLQKGRFQPQNYKFPQSTFGGKQRRLNISWFDDNKYWLEYSIKENAAFFLCCYLFKSDVPNQGGSDHFVKSGFKAWNRKSGLDDHKAGTPHNIDVQRCQNLMNQRQSITSAFEKQIILQEKEYRTHLNASIDCVRILLRQGLAFRGHDEKDDSDNKDAVMNVIMEDLGKECLTILVDESHDVSCKEQLALVLRFVNKNREVVERFVVLRHVSDTSALTLKATIYDMLSKWNLSHTSTRGQGYDGASNMSGAFNGLKTLIMNETKCAYIIPCFSHQLQLALVFVAKNHMKKEQADKVMEALVEGELESGIGLNQEVGIKRPYVLEDLGKDNSDRDRKAEALRILRLLKSFDFVFCLHLMVDILRVTDHLNTTLQRKDHDIVNTMNQNCGYGR
ncbi:unnamed protein product [Lactuca saligna]|uniref:TTF-type domain-containing protein n=1 Tax=Lactuca saligna TaxID=75948 RepID=A0AA35V084_LACSI|nr:unnamed protein product [Lactuca saligna]